MTLSNWIKKSEVIRPEILDLIDQTFLGSRGARYRLMNSKERSIQLDNPLFYYVERNEKVLGNITFCNRINGDVSENYIRYFTFQKGFQAKKEHSNKHFRGKSQLKIFFGSVMESDAFEKNEHYSYYAFVDDQNFKSMHMADQFGFEKIGQFQTRSFSRTQPKARIEIKELKGSDLTHYLEELKKQYASYNFFHPVNIQKGKVFGYFKHDVLQFAATFHPTQWEIQALPGKKGELKINLLSKMPIIRNFFKNQKFSFLGIEGIIFTDPKLCNAFFESVLNQMNFKSALIWSDVKCPVFKKIDPFMKKGILARFSRQEDANIIAKNNLKSINYTINPSYISPYDIS